MFRGATKAYISDEAVCGHREGTQDTCKPYEAEPFVDYLTVLKEPAAAQEFGVVRPGISTPRIASGDPHLGVQRKTAHARIVPCRRSGPSRLPPLH